MFRLQSSSVTYPSLLKSSSLKSYWLCCSLMSLSIFLHAAQTSSSRRTYFFEPESAQKSLNDWVKSRRYLFCTEAVFVHPFFDNFQCIIVLSVEILYFACGKTCRWHFHDVWCFCVQKRSVEAGHCSLHWGVAYWHAQFILQIVSSCFVNIKKVVWFVWKFGR